MKHKKIIIAASAALLLPSLVFASSAKQLVTKIIKGQATITKEFKSIGNLEGFVLAPKNGRGQKTIVYANKNGWYMVAGAVIDASGKNITQADFQKYVESAVAPKAYKAAGSVHSILVGNPKAPHKAFVIVEPNCSACHMLYKSLKPMIASGQLALKLIVVAFLKPDSEAKAAAILQAKDPSKAFGQDEAGFKMRTESGSIQPAKAISIETKGKLKANLALMSKFGFVGTPVMIYKTNGGQYNVVRGFLPGPALKEAVKSMAS